MRGVTARKNLILTVTVTTVTVTTCKKRNTFTQSLLQQAANGKQNLKLHGQHLKRQLTANHVVCVDGKPLNQGSGTFFNERAILLHLLADMTSEESQNVLFFMRIGRSINWIAINLILTIIKCKLNSSFVKSRESHLRGAASMPQVTDPCNTQRPLSREWPQEKVTNVGLSEKYSEKNSSIKGIYRWNRFCRYQE